MPPIEDQRRTSVTYARTSGFSELDHQLMATQVPTWGLVCNARSAAAGMKITISASARVPSTNGPL